MSESGENTERTVVKTYVPEYQKERWQVQADALDMSQSEFVRTMVQAGRRGFTVEPEEPRSSTADPGGDGLEDRVLELLAREDYLSWDELVEGLVGNVEERLDTTLEELQQENRVGYSGRNGGYTLREGTRGSRD